MVASGVGAMVEVKGRLRAGKPQVGGGGGGGDGKWQVNGDGGGFVLVVVSRWVVGGDGGDVVVVLVLVVVQVVVVVASWWVWLGGSVAVLQQVHRDCCPSGREVELDDEGYPTIFSKSSNSKASPKPKANVESKATGARVSLYDEDGFPRASVSLRDEHEGDCPVISLFDEDAGSCPVISLCDEDQVDTPMDHPVPKQHGTFEVAIASIHPQPQKRKAAALARGKEKKQTAIQSKADDATGAAFLQKIRLAHSLKPRPRAELTGFVDGVRVHIFTLHQASNGRQGVSFGWQING